MSDTSLHGIPQIQWDIIAKIIPGLSFLTLSWGSLIDSIYANQAWDALAKQPYLWIGVPLLAYLIGFMADCVSWPFTVWQARIWHRRLSRKSYEANSWNAALRDYAVEHRNIPETVYVEKAQVESRACMNLCVLLGILLVLMLGLDLLRGAGNMSLVFSALKGSCWTVFVIGVAAAFLIACLMAFSRQRRRVWGVLSIQSTHQH